MFSYGRPVWAEINLQRIKNNVRQVRKLVGKKEIMAVVKANGYGHGAYEVAKACLEEGVQRLAVAILNEGIELREKGLKCPILVLGWTPQEDYKHAIEKDITLTCFNSAEARALNRQGEKASKKAKVHLKIDTGMSRIGLLPNDDNLEVVREIIQCPYLEVEGIFTHLAKADELDKGYSYWQLERFLDFVNKIEEATGYKIPYKHAANSAAIIDIPQAHLDLVRPGIILYGLPPSQEVNLHKVDLQPAFSLKARISRVEKFPSGTKVSYGGKFTTTGETIIATLPIGYADGYTRLLTNKGEVIFKDGRLPVIGRICMDQCMVDASLYPEIKRGDEVILLGAGEGDSISADELAEKLGTINYEIVCMISPRVPRVYLD